jgi:hypothetical protein
MANGHGGARIGAGQKKKALADNLLEGNPGKRKITILEFPDTADLSGEAMPPIREYLAAKQKNGKENIQVMHNQELRSQVVARKSARRGL